MHTGQYVKRVANKTNGFVNITLFSLIPMRKEVDKNYQIFTMLLFNPITWELERIQRFYIKCNET